MIKFDIVTIFPKIFSSWASESLIARGQKKKLLRIKAHNLRRWSNDAHKTVDDRPFGGGLGMVLKIEPIYRAVAALSKVKTKRKVILFTPRGKQFTQQMAHKLSQLEQIVFICGRYEGVDERVASRIADIELSIGPYDLMGGELAAMVVMETVARLVPGVLGKPQLLKERITKAKGFIEYPQYTRPEIFKTKEGKKWPAPKVLMSGDHKKIEKWKKEHGKEILA
ncbi:MAG: tRNA (guanosine(37)-N1)-methyltransferase TrmD [Patescibacteria group bacterium]